MKELATRIQNAERLEAMATTHITAACALFDSLSQPKIQIPRKTDSR